MKKIIKKIVEYDKIMIFGHVRPDGDCYGSQFGLKNIIKETFPEKQVYVVGDSSMHVGFLGEVDKLSDEEFNNALGIVVDTPVCERISDKRYKMCREIIKIDHHPAEENFGTLNYSLPDYPACTEIIADLYWKNRNKLKLNKDGASALYIGLLTDTGGFRHSGVTKRTFHLAGNLMEFGIDNEDINYYLSKETINQFIYKADLYSQYKIIEEGFIYLVVKQETILKHNITEEEAGAIINIIGGIEGYPIWALVIEGKNEIRIRLRSNGPVINKLAEKYGGGGHPKAAGAKLSSFGEIDNFINDVKEVLKEYKRL